MKSFKKIIHEVWFSNFRQDWEISLKWDLESVENVKVMAHNYHENKFTHSTDITDTLGEHFIENVLDTLDLHDEDDNYTSNEEEGK